MGGIPKALEGAGTVLCSACLLGFRCRYDGTDRRLEKVERALRGKAVVPICPEVAGGLPIPRPPADFEGGSGSALLEGRAGLIDREGRRVDGPFLAGAQRALEAARRFGAEAALLKDGSPSCGAHRVQVDGQPARGQGVAAAVLDRAGVPVISEEDLPD